MLRFISSVEVDPMLGKRVVLAALLSKQGESDLKLFCHSLDLQPPSHSVWLKTTSTHAIYIETLMLMPAHLETLKGFVDKIIDELLENRWKEMGNMICK
jgi:hypothetical protein